MRHPDVRGNMEQFVLQFVTPEFASPDAYMRAIVRVLCLFCSAPPPFLSSLLCAIPSPTVPSVPVLGIPAPLFACALMHRSHRVLYLGLRGPRHRHEGGTGVVF
jgi:hypothetical protein